jgi:hypothetical protein
VRLTPSAPSCSAISSPILSMSNLPRCRQSSVYGLRIAVTRSHMDTGDGGPAHRPGAADVVVVGAGAAGAAAALQALAGGCTVLGVDAGPVFGGTALYSGAGACVAGSPLQAAQGIRTTRSPRCTTCSTASVTRPRRGRASTSSAPSTRSTAGWRTRGSPGTTSCTARAIAFPGATCRAGAGPPSWAPCAAASSARDPAAAGS